MSEYPCLTVLVSTKGDGIFSLKKTVSLQYPEICYLIVHQTKKQLKLPEFLKREDIKVISTATTGLSKSRNIAIKNCNTDYGLIADDDIEYIPEGIERVIKIIKSEKPDFATFKIKTLEGEPEYKNYAERSFNIAQEFHHYYSSIEILLNVKLLKKKKIYFDHRFGLGTKINAAEESILIYDMVANNLVGNYYPIYIVNHPFDSSGKQGSGQNLKIFIKGALAARTNNFNHKIKGNSRLRKVLNYFIYYYGVFYIKYRLPEFLMFLK